MKTFFKTYWKVMLAIILVITIQVLTYFSAKLINKNFHHYDFTLSIDRRVPFQMGWIYIYVLAFAWWGLSPILIFYYAKEKQFKRYLVTAVIILMTSLLFFIFLPTTIDRPEVVGNTLTHQLTRFIFASDTPPTNLFPSIHVAISWLLYVAVRKVKDIPKWFFWLQFTMAILVSLSTQFLKQHYIVDFILAVFLVEVIFYLVKCFNGEQLLKKIEF